MTTMASAAGFRRESVVASWMRTAHRLLHFSEGAIAPFLDLSIRLGLAQLFVLSGLLKLADWDNALLLAWQEYPVSWLDPGVAAVLGVSVEVGGGLLLALGLATRLAALPLLILSLVIQVEYQALNEHIYWAIFFVWYLVFGAGALSLDRLIGRGLGLTALPLAEHWVALTTFMQSRLGPVCKLLLRLFLAQLPFGALIWSLPSFDYTQAVHVFGSSGLTMIAAAACVALGLFARPAALLIALWLGGRLMQLEALPQIEAVYLGALFTRIAVLGPGPLALDQLLFRALRKRFPQLDGLPAVDLSALPHVVIVGAGFGGLSCARALQHTACRVTLVDQRNYHLFQPLLYQVATASLSPADIATPIRELFREQPNVRVCMQKVTGIDSARREVITTEQRIGFDYLVLATGARHSYFGRDEWEPHAPGLKRIEDSTDVRRRLLVAFEQAENAEDDASRGDWLTFVIIGGGPTGVELAGAVAELARHGLQGDFRRADPAKARVLLVQSGPRLLPAFDARLANATEKALRELGVEVLLNSRVERVDGESVTINGAPTRARTVFWAAGVAASPAAEWLGAERDRAGRIKVQRDLSVPGHPGIFAIGDTALANAWNGDAVPGLAPAAKQGGEYVADLVRRQLEDAEPPPPFRYRHLGSLATIGRKAAVADLGWIRLSGPLAWWFWGAIHVLFLAGMRNRLAVAIEWFWAYLTYRRSTRLITGGG